MFEDFLIWSDLSCAIALKEKRVYSFVYIKLCVKQDSRFIKCLEMLYN